MTRQEWAKARDERDDALRKMAATEIAFDDKNALEQRKSRALADCALQLFEAQSGLKNIDDCNRANNAMLTAIPAVTGPA